MGIVVAFDTFFRHGFNYGVSGLSAMVEGAVSFACARREGTNSKHLLDSIVALQTR